MAKKETQKKGGLKADVLRINKKKRIEIRVSTLDYYAIKQAANIHGLTVSTYVRKKATGQQLPKALTEEEMTYKKLLENTVSNFKRISNYIKWSDKDKTLIEIQELIRIFKEETKSKLW